MRPLPSLPAISAARPRGSGRGRCGLWLAYRVPRAANPRLYAPFTCKVGVSSEERLCKKSGLARSEYGSKGRVRCTDAPQPLGRRNGLD